MRLVRHSTKHRPASWAKAARKHAEEEMDEKRRRFAETPDSRLCARVSA